MNWNIVMEKLSALLLLFLLIGLMVMLIFVELPKGSEQVVLVIIGGLMVIANQGLPKLFGADDKEKEVLKKRLEKLEIEYVVLKQNYADLTNTLIKHHVIADGQGLVKTK